MKKLLSLILVFMAGNLAADTTAFETVLFHGGIENAQVRLFTEKTRTEYRNVEVPSTCYETRWRTRCHSEGGHCRSVCDSRGVCRPVCSPPRRVCRQYPERYPYPCTRVERRAYQVHDYDVESNISAVIDGSAAITAQETIVFRATGNTDSITVDGSGKNLIRVFKKEVTEQRLAGLLKRNINYVLKVETARAASNVSAHGIQNVSLRNGVFNFSLHQSFDLAKFDAKIRVFKNRRLGRDTLLRTADLTEATMVATSGNANSTNYAVDLRALNIRVPSQVRIILDVKYKVDESTILNRGQIDLDTSANWVFR